MQFGGGLAGRGDVEQIVEQQREFNGGMNMLLSLLCCGCIIRGKLHYIPSFGCIVIQFAGYLSDLRPERPKFTPRRLSAAARAPRAITIDRIAHEAAVDFSVRAARRACIALFGENL
jgi:hypothetical protein